MGKLIYSINNKCSKTLDKQTHLLQLVGNNMVTCFLHNTVYKKNFVLQ